MEDFSGRNYSHYSMAISSSVVAEPTVLYGTVRNAAQESTMNTLRSYLFHDVVNQT